MKKFKANLFIAAILFTFSFPAAAQEVATTASSFQAYQSFYYVIGALLIVMFFMVLTMLRLAKLISEQHYHILHGKPMETASAVQQQQKEDWMSKMWKNLTASVPKGVEKDVMLDHNYDGIRELDNRMPPWLQYIFISTVLAAVSYLFVFHVYHIGKLPREEYAAELQMAADQKSKMLLTAGSAVDESSVKQLTDATALAGGKSIFIAKCAACHGQLGEGGVGPNLTDDYWLHGGSISEIFKTVKYGVPAKGMVSWTGILKPEEMQTVASFIMSLHGTNPPNPKAPQGDKLVPQITTTADSAAASVDTTKVKS
ncbi:MAG: c-type cytochrome [Chitinophagales bacterium]|nr:c-type cytochrome [Chitinophagales bacterium]